MLIVIYLDVHIHPDGWMSNDTVNFTNFMRFVPFKIVTINLLNFSWEIKFNQKSIILYNRF